MAVLITCRICSNSKSCVNFENIFESEITYDDIAKSDKLCELIVRITGIMIFKDDGLPQNICINCKEQFENAAKLIILCQISDKKFRNVHNKSIIIKEEPSTNGDNLDVFKNTDASPKNEEDLVVHDEHIAKLRQSSEVDSSFHSEDENNTTVQCMLYDDKSNYDVDKPYKCDQCDSKFKSKSNLIGHRNNVHKGYKQHSCTECDKTFFSSTHLKIHEMTHTKKYPHLCAQCGKRFAQHCNLKAHQKVHSGIKDIKCLYCDFTTCYQSSIKAHIKVVHIVDKKYQCSECGLKFMFPSLLARHVSVHTGLKEHLCKVCKKNFRSISNLKQHERIHSNEKPYKCIHCEKVFKTHSQKNAHIQIHTGKKNHICIICEKSFLFGANLKRHQKIHNKTL